MIDKIREYIDDLGFVGIISFMIIFIIILIISYAFYQELSFGSHYGKIVNKEYYPSYVSSYGKGDITYSGESYKLLLERNNKRLWVNVTKDEYNNLKIGDCYYKCE